jgi:ribonuclease HI
MKKKTSKRHKKSIPPAQTIERIFTDGSGARPDGNGSAIAWLRESDGASHVESISGLTNNQAEYRAIISALESVPLDSIVTIFSDSQVVIYQIHGVYRVNSDCLIDLRNRVNAIVTLRNLTATFQWIPRTQNRADALLRRNGKQASSPKRVLTA